MLMPTAAATLTPPSEVSAFGVSSASPSPAPPLSLDSWSAKPRCPLTCSVTPLRSESAGVPLGDASAGAPAAEPSRSAPLSDAPFAEIVTAPPAVMLR